MKKELTKTDLTKVVGGKCLIADDTFNIFKISVDEIMANENLSNEKKFDEIAGAAYVACMIIDYFYPCEPTGSEAIKKIHDVTRNCRIKLGILKDPKIKK